MNRLVLFSLSLLALAGCNPFGSDSDPVSDACPIEGATATDEDGRVIATPDALIQGEMAVHYCDSTSPTGSRWWLVKRIKTGRDANRQDGLLVDSGNNVLNVSSLSGLTSATQKKVPGTNFTAACHNIDGGGDGCKVVKAEPVEETDTVTITVPKGTKVVVGN